MSEDLHGSMRHPPPPPPPPPSLLSEPPLQHTYIPGQDGNFGHCQPNMNPHPYPNQFRGHNPSSHSLPPPDPHPPSLHNNPPPMFSAPPTIPPRFPPPPSSMPPPNIPYQDAFHNRPMMTPRECGPAWHLNPPPVPQCQVRGPAPITQPEMQIKTMTHREDEDAKWLGEFEKKLKACPPQPPPSLKGDTMNVKLVDIQRMVMESYSLRKELCDLEKQLIEMSSSAEEEEWGQLVQKTDKTKDKLNKILETFKDPKFIKHTQALLKQRRAKRNRVKRKKQEKQLERKELERKRKEEEAKIDVWRAKVKREEDSKRQEEAVKREADSVLGEVRQKQNEGQKMLQLLEALAGLRNTRAVQAVAQGQPRDTEAEKRFTNTTEMLAKVVKEQLKEYELEEQTLRVMMEESASHRSAALTAKGDANFARYEDSIRKLLFGPTATPDFPHDAQQSLETLLQRRSEWDQFVADEDNPLASGVPLSWVLPPAQPDPSWAAFLKR